MHMPRARDGFLVLADIAGYTAFLTGTELEHAQAIVEELTSLIRARLAPPLRFVKLEGDAVFCYADDASFQEGERLLELLEACYRDFSDRLFDMARATTCPCAACSAIETLDLKFIAHHGTYVVQTGVHGEDPVGPDVIIAHRLLKNHITDDFGCRAYVFLTSDCLKRMPVTLGLPEHSETPESFAEMVGVVEDLKPVLLEMREAQRVYIGAADADFEMAVEGPHAPAVVWQYCVDPQKRARWVTNERSVTYRPNTHGRIGIGANSHCAHGFGADALRHYVDWRPYHYFTDRVASPKGEPMWTETYEFVEREDGGTAGSIRIRLDNRSLMARVQFHLIFAPILRLFLFRRSIANLLRILDEDARSMVIAARDDEPLEPIEGAVDAIAE